MTMPEPASPLPWEIYVSYVGPNQAERWCIGKWNSEMPAASLFVAECPNEQNAKYIVCAANAYPRLKAQLDKAMEACRAILQTQGLYERASEAIREGPDWSDEYSAAADAAWRQTVRLAREAVEMAKGRVDEHGTE